MQAAVDRLGISALEQSPNRLPSLLHHHLDELLIVDLAITVHISLPDHLVHLLICQLLPQIRHHMPQLQSSSS